MGRGSTTSATSALWRRQPVEEARAPSDGLPRVLGSVELTALGVGAIIGAGIFALVGTAAAGDAVRPGAGPALLVSFALTGLACSFCALCYAELASLVPSAGSAYAYAYRTLGEIAAWVIGWDLILEYAVGNVAVAVAWSGYARDLLAGFGVELPLWLATSTRSGLAQPELLAEAPRVLGWPIVVNLPAAGIVLAVTAVLIVGVRASARLNGMLVAFKLAVLVFFIAAGAFYVKPENWVPFAPNGWSPVITGAAVIFFAYIGFDAISTAAEETRRPERDLPRAILGSLVISGVLYMGVAAVLTGIVPWRELGVSEPLGLAFRRLHLGWATYLVDVGAVVATTAVLLVFQLAQPRIFFAMARDGLLPRTLARVHPRFGTPWLTTLVTGCIVAAGAAIFDIDEAADLTNIGTLFAFVLVCAGVLVLRRRRPDLPRPFRCPGVPWIPLLGIASCAVLMVALPAVTWLRFVIWLAVGLAIYAAFGWRHSQLATRG
jgi:APA family basic amino acid/polyamine antiporter